MRFFVLANALQLITAERTRLLSLLYAVVHLPTVVRVLAFVARIVTCCGATTAANSPLASLFDVLLDVGHTHLESLGRSWDVVDAFEFPDGLIDPVESAGEKTAGGIGPFAVFNPRLNAAFAATRTVPWIACHDMIPTLLLCSRQSRVILSKKTNSDELPPSLI